MATTSERDLGGTETGQPVRDPPVPEGGLSKQADQLLAEFAVASRHFEEAQHLAGFADGVAQELINRFSVRRLVETIVSVKERGGRLFYDVLCTLIPRRADRGALYDEIHTRASQVRESYAAAEQENGDHHTHATPNPHRDEWETVRAQVRYVDFCKRRDGRSMLKRVLQGANGVDEAGVVCHHFSTFAMTDPEALIARLEGCGGDLHAYYDRELKSFQALLERIRSFIGTVQQDIAQVRMRVAKQVPFVIRGEQLDRDRLRMENTIFESSLGQRAQAQMIDVLTGAIHQLEGEVAAAAMRDPEAVTLHGIMERVQRAVGLVTENGGRTEEI
ncbi:TPA: hypothetical protein DCL30_04880 [Candidatus Peribacteria bacterium]|nr:MAG: hypothetical protein A2529_04940 [Candidatus Peribacteria bacterium RIFOXYD2_FULL_58_15]HAI98837.1 hypothetical protein [Candidatus Peribacteria bacterium]HAS34041.1 hypothetical protein [Candidatus Peribacteria bacterium]